jgi:hypothetical protein
VSLPRPLQIAGQTAAWALFITVTGVFAQWPTYAPLAAGHGELKLSMAHLTSRLEACVQLTQEEIVALPPNMRVSERCPRARADAVVQLVVDGRPLVERTVRPAGLARGGRAYLQGYWSLPAGAYALEFRLRDTPRIEGFDKVQHLHLDLAPGESVLLNVGDGIAHLVPGRNPGPALTKESP